MSKRPMKTAILPGSALGFLIFFATFAQVHAATLYVDITGGQDGQDCGTTELPCSSIQQAVNLANAGDEIRVAAGTYTYQAAIDPCAADNTAVVCVRSTTLSLLGGFASGSWVTPDPDTNLTVIDGEQQYRGVLISESTFEMEGFSLINGLAGPKDDDDNAFGGGMSATLSDLILSDLVFQQNTARGRDTASGAGGAGAGGGLAIRGTTEAKNMVQLTSISFTGNLVEGGDGPDAGGFAIGGGLFVSYTTLTGTALEATSNVARAGATQGDGSIQGVEADSLGAGMAFMKGAAATLDQLSATSNSGYGGDAGVNAGSAYGAGVYGEEADITIIQGTIQGNHTEGGAAEVGGRGVGAGMMTLASKVTLDRVSVINNECVGGTGSTQVGGGGGGGLFFEDRDASQWVEIINTMVAGNTVTYGSGAGSRIGGGGGGIFFLGAQGEVLHSTIADNWIEATPLQGRGIVLVTRLGTTGANIDLAYSIVSDHEGSGGDAAIHVKSGSAITFNGGLFAANGTDTNGDGSFVNLGGVGSVAAVGYLAPGSPTYDYHLSDGSPAIGQATGSTTLIDLDGGLRDESPDLGADEYGAVGELLFWDDFESGTTAAWWGTIGGS